MFLIFIPGLKGQQEDLVKQIKRFLPSQGLYSFELLKIHQFPGPLQVFHDKAFTFYEKCQNAQCLFLLIGYHSVSWSLFNFLFK